MNGLTGYNGRIGRKGMWKGILLYNLGAFVLSYLAVAVLGQSNSLAFLILIQLAVIAGMSSVCIRRLHDHDMSGWYYLGFFIPLYNIYLIVICLFLRGTEGPNGYGHDPLGSGKVDIQPLLGDVNKP